MPQRHRGSAMVKVAYFGHSWTCGGWPCSLATWFIIVIPVAYLGGIASQRVLKAMEDQQFKKVTNRNHGCWRYLLTGIFALFASSEKT